LVSFGDCLVEFVTKQKRRLFDRLEILTDLFDSGCTNTPGRSLESPRALLGKVESQGITLAWVALRMGQ
jgi:hypothetical protein